LTLFIVEQVLKLLDLKRSFLTGGRLFLHVFNLFVKLFDLFVQFATGIDPLFELFLEMQALLQYLFFLLLFTLAQFGDHSEVSLQCIHCVYLVFEFFAKHDVAAFEVCIGKIVQ